MKRVKVLLADDHAIVAEGLQSLLEEECEFVGRVVDGRAMIDAVMREKPDIVVTDISMPLLNGIDAVRRLKEMDVRTKVIILTMHDDPRLAAEALRAGASGFVLKHSACEELLTSINEVMNGRTYITPRITGDLVQELMKSGPDTPRLEDQLSLRQREILQMIAEGKTMKEIASMLDISARTVESHKYEIMRVLGVETTADLIRFAVKIGMTS